MTVLRPAPVSTRQFSLDPSTRRLVAEISSTNGFGRVYDDACDVGLTLVGPTGSEVVYVVSSERRDADGDIVDWTLVPANAGRPHDAAITLFND